jgi:ubiquinone/menaquinone biosynthesis C-methylase UbiE
MKVTYPAEIIGNTDIYLLDQISKGRYLLKETILDAGCGTGRNMFWFYKNGFKLLAIDNEKEQIEIVKARFPNQSDNFQVASLSNLPYQDNSIHHIICCAVLHFVKNQKEFKQYVAELVRVLKSGGSLFIRMTSEIGIENGITHLGNGVYRLPDGTERFLLTRTLLKEIIVAHRLSFLEPIKTVNVDDVRCMTTLMLKK